MAAATKFLAIAAVVLVAGTAAAASTTPPQFHRWGEAARHFIFHTRGNSANHTNASFVPCEEGNHGAHVSAVAHLEGDRDHNGTGRNGTRGHGNETHDHNETESHHGDVVRAAAHDACGRGHHHGEAGDESDDETDESEDAQHEQAAHPDDRDHHGDD